MTRAAAIGVEVTGASRIFEGGVAAFENLDLSVEKGDFVALVGPSGCGKSTLLRLIAGLDPATRGEARLVGAEAAARSIAYVFQDAHLLPWRTLLDNVTLPLELLGIERKERQNRAAETLTTLGLGDALTRYPAALSGGMRMRASLARALVTRPALLLLDEPFAALDELTRERLDKLLRDIWIERQMTVIFVTHALHEATYLAERAVVLSPRPARIVLDRRIDLPRIRDVALRTDPALAQQARLLWEALSEPA